MDQPESEGIRLISFDGGDIHAVSQLLILDEFMRRVEWDRKSTARILPCDYFHMMAGVGTGGIVVVLLAILRMEIEEAIKEFIEIWTVVFADADLDQEARSDKLEVTIKGLLERRGLRASQKLYNGDREDSRCKAFVCAVPEYNLGMCEKFRSYKSKQTSTNPTIIEAIRATCAVPTLFTPVSIESVGCHISYVTGAYNFNNPAWETIKEACQTFGQRQLVACMLSLGCGQRPTTRLSQRNEATVMSLVSDIASDSELVDRDLAWRIGKSNVYYRFSVDRTLESGGGDSVRDLIGGITSCTRVFLEHATTADKVNQCTKASECLGKVTLTDISGLNEPKLATAHGLPSLSAFFVERPGLIKKMADCLFRVGPPVQRRIVLSGMGGIGKTQITISFLHQFLSRFRHVLFIDGSSVQSLESDVVAKIKSLGVTYSRTSASEALGVLVNPDHEITRNWAIVYDNVDNRDINIADYFPPCSFGTIFITTRNHSLGNLAPKAHLKLDFMSEEEAASVLLQSAFDASHLITEADAGHAREIAKELGYLPVALVQAGYFIKLHDCIQDYRQRLRKKRPDILSRPAQDQLNPHYHGVYATLNVTWPHLSPRAQNLMSILGFVNYTGFPILLLYRAADRSFLFEPFNLTDRPALFQQTVQLLCATFRPDKEPSKQDVDDIVAELERYSLVARTTAFTVTTLRLHPLVHSWAHDKLSQEEKEVYQAAAVRLLVCGTGDEDEDIFDLIYPHVALMSDRLDNLHTNDRAGLATILAHQGDLKTAIELWEGIQRSVLVLYGRNDVRSGEADLQLARLYWSSGDGEKHGIASVLEKEVVDTRKRTLTPKHPMTMKAIVQLARGMARNYKKLDDAASLLQDSLKFWERQPGDNWDMILQVKRELAGCCDVEESVGLCTEVLQARMERNGPDHPATLKAMENLAYAYEDLDIEDDPASSDRAFNEKVTAEVTDIWKSVVDVRTGRRGVEHPDTITAMQNLAWSYNWQDFTVECIAQWKEVVELRKKVQGPHHHDTLYAMDKVADNCEVDEKYPEAEAQWREVVSLQKEIHVPGPISAPYAMKRLADMYGTWGKYTKAEVQWKEVLHLTRQELGPSHEDTLSVMRKLAKLYEKQKKFSEAGIQMKEIARLVGEERGTSHQETLTSMTELTNKLEGWRMYTEAAVQMKEVICVMKQKSGPSHMDTLAVMKRLAWMYHKAGQYSESMQQRKEIVRLMRETHGPYHEDTLKAIGQLAEMHEMYKQYDEAEVQRKEAVHWCKEVQGLTHHNTLQAMEGLAWMYHKAKRYSEAAKQRNEIVDLVKIARSHSHLLSFSAIKDLGWMCESSGQYTEAEAQWKGAVRLAKETKGPSHEDTLDAMRELAKMYERAEQYSEAEEQWKEIVHLTKNARGLSHTDTRSAVEVLAKKYEAWGKYAEAAGQWKVVVYWTEQARGATHKDTLDARGNLAKMHEKAGQYSEAADQCKEIVHLTKQAHGPKHEDTLKAMQNLALIYQETKRDTEATDQWREIVHLVKEMRGASYGDQVGAIGQLGRPYRQWRQWRKHTEAAEQQQLVRSAEEVRSLTHDDTLDAIAQLAKVCEKAEEYTEWEAQLKEGIRLAKEARGLNREDTIQAMTGLAKMYQAWRKYTESEDQWKEIVRLTKGEYGPDGWHTIEAMTSLAKMYEICERYTDAAEQWEEILRLEKRSEDPNYWFIRKTMKSLAKIHEKRGQHNEAVARWEEIVRSAHDTETSDHWEILCHGRDLARVYEWSEQYAEAAAQLEEIEWWTNGIKDPVDWSVSSDTRQLARMYERSEQYTKAAEKWEEIVRLTKNAKGLSAGQKFGDVECLAKVYMKAERYEEAGNLMLDVIQGVAQDDEHKCFIRRARELYEEARSTLVPSSDNSSAARDEQEPTLRVKDAARR